jgi:glycosyltransferase involved in cell wall biosynthesis
MRPLGRERLGGVAVIRSAGLPAPNRGTVRRLADHATHAAGMVASAAASGRSDVVVAETPPLFTAGAAIAYARIKRAPLVVNVADRWPESVVQLGAVSNRRAIAAAEWLERSCYRAAARITVPTHGLVEDLDRLPDARGKVVHMPPAVDLERFDPAGQAREGPLRVLYAGTIGLAQGLATLVVAARLAGPDAVQVTIIGAGAEALQVAAQARDVPNVRLLGTVPSDRIPALYADADAAAVLLRDKPLFEAALPTKMLEAMAAGRPVLLAARGEAAALIKDASAGIVVAPDDAGALAGAIRQLAADRALAVRLGAAGRRRAEDCFGREQSVHRWLSLLESLSASRTRRAPASAVRHPAG